MITEKSRTSSSSSPPRYTPEFLLPPEWRILPGQHGTLCGQNGTGKTTLARYEVDGANFVLLLDTKDDTDGSEGGTYWPGYETVRSWSALKEWNKNEKLIAEHPRIRYIPSARVQYELLQYRDEENDIAKVFRWVFERRNTFLYVDEVFQVTSGAWLPQGYHACLTQGRKRKISVLSATQRPATIPPVIFTESRHLWCFYLQRAADRETMEDYMGVDRFLIKDLPDFYFYYRGKGRVAQGPIVLDIKRGA